MKVGGKVRRDSGVLEGGRWGGIIKTHVYTRNCQELKK